MTKPIRGLFIGMLMAMACAHANACSCSTNDVDRYIEQDELAKEVFANAEFFAHVKVVALLPDNAARLQAIESFKGKAPTEVRAPPGSTPRNSCDMSFSVGKELVIFSRNKDRKISFCNAILDLHPNLLQALREMAKRQLDSTQPRPPKVLETTPESNEPPTATTAPNS